MGRPGRLSYWQLNLSPADYFYDQGQQARGNQWAYGHAFEKSGGANSTQDQGRHRAAMALHSQILQPQTAQIGGKEGKDQGGNAYPALL